MRLTWWIGTASFLVLLLSLGLLAFLGLHKFEQQLEEITDARIRVTAIDVRLAIENTLGLGLPLEDSHGIQAIVERAAAADPQIAAIAVFDLEHEPGRILFAHGPALSPPPADIRSRPVDKTWQWTGPHGAKMTGWPLIDPLHRGVGLLAVEVRQDRQSHLVAEAKQQVATVAAVLAVLMAAAIAVAMKRVVAPLEESIVRAHHILTAGSSAEARSDLERLAVDFMHATDATAHHTPPDIAGDTKA